ncbi:MAG: FtsW/RodA/SpoVE family cell cycle protein [Gemmatimonadota bacterium]
MTGIVPPNATADRANGRSLLPRTIGGWLPVIAPLVMVFGFMLGCRERLLSWIREQLAWWFGATFLLFTILSAFASNGRVRGTTPWEFFLPLFVIGWATTLADDSYNISRRTVLRLRVLLQLAIYGALPVSLFVFNPGTRDLGIAVVLAASFAAMLVVGTRRGWWAVIMGFVWIALVLAAFRFDDRSATRLALAYAPYRDPATMSVNAASEWAAKVHQIKLFDANIQAGGLIGAGPGRGHGETAPNAADDGVFTLFASQWGWIGALSLVVLYSALLIHALEVAARERSAFDRCVVTGLTMMIGVPFWLASLGAVRVLPLTGVAAGFVAHGGSKLVASSLAIGLIAAISHRQSQTVASDRDVETAPVMNIKTVIAGR